MNWRRRRRRRRRKSDGVVDSKTTISTSLPPRPFGPPLLFQEGSCFYFSFSFSSNSFTPSLTASLIVNPGVVFLAVLVSVVSSSGTGRLHLGGIAVFAGLLMMAVGCRFRK